MASDDMLPLGYPQVELTGSVDKVSCCGSVMVMLDDAIQPLASNTEMEYTPPGRDVKVDDD